jgi:hypothetical protein
LLDFFFTENAVNLDNQILKGDYLVSFHQVVPLQPFWMSGNITEHNFRKGPPKELYI